MTGPAVDPRDLRVSDDERSNVLGLLEKATGRGLIDLDEYQRRSAVVIRARTRAELNGTVVDLPGLLLRPIGGRCHRIPAGAPWFLRCADAGFGSGTRAHRLGFAVFQGPLAGDGDHRDRAKKGGAVNIRYPRAGIFGR